MAPFARRCALALVLVASASSAGAARAEAPLSLYPGPWRVAAQLRLHGETDGGASFARPDAPVVANVILDAASGRFGVSLWRKDELWLLQVGALGSDRRGRPQLAPDELFESGVVELACAALDRPPPCDAPLDALEIEIAESTARARVEKGVLRVSGKLRLVIFDPRRPELRIRVSASYDGRGEPGALGGNALDLALR
jgi:hypothetical protein